MQEKQRAFLVRTAYWAVWTALLWLGVRYLLRWLLPFILALGVGISHVRSDKRAEADSFGLVALCSIGPILSVLLPVSYTHLGAEEEDEESNC